MIDWLKSAFEHFEVARIFLIIAIGYFLGEIKLPGNFRFGMAAVLFVGMAFGAWIPSFTLPEVVLQMGLALFVYCVGLQAAPGFFQCFKKDGLRLNLAVLAATLFAFGLTWLCIVFSGRPKEIMTGLFCGALTNTPALGAATEWITRNGGGSDAAASAVVGYGVVYPFAVVTLLLLIQLRHARRSKTETGISSVHQLPRPQTIEIQTLDRHHQPWRVADIAEQTGLTLTRYRVVGEKTKLVEDDTPLPVGTLVVVVGNAKQVEAGVALLGKVGAEPLETDLEDFAVHRYFVSNQKLAGRKLGEIGLEKLGAIVSRLRRGDVDLMVNDDTVLHLGDRVKVVSYRHNEPQVRKFFGNSLQILTENGYLSFAFGILLGLLVGKIPIPLGLSQPVYLGYAGGPLVVSLILGYLGRTGPFVWNIPISTNLALRHFGILLFLAVAGVRAGSGLIEVLKHDGLFLIGCGVAITTVSHLFLWLILAWQKQKEAPVIFGVSSAFQTQPAALAFAGNRVSQGPLNLAYATVYPLAMVLKVALAQLLLLVS